MKSSKQRRAEIREKRSQKIKQNQQKPAREYVYFDDLAGLDFSGVVIPAGAIAVNPASLIMSSTFAYIPAFYQDILFQCVQCDDRQIWTAKAQRWWYEIAQGDIESTAKYCRSCRLKKREQAKISKKIHFSGLVKKHGLEKAAKMLQLDAEDVKGFVADKA